jgi:molybdate transport system substrate-binding protein
MPSRGRFALRTAAVLLVLLCCTTAAGRSPNARYQSADPQPLTVAAASNLQAAFPELASRFERSAGVKVNVSFGSSGNFVAQIRNGAPFDVFVSADVEYPEQLVKSGHADAASLYQYATGRIVLWTRNGSGVDVQRGLSVLQDAKIRRVAIANPQHAPYGRAAVAALKSAKVYDAIRGKLVLGENISQTAQLVDSGNADVGILALSLAVGPPLNGNGTYAEIPASAHPPIDQAAVILSASRHKETARRFLAFLEQPDTIRLLERFGFAAPRTVAR